MESDLDPRMLWNFGKVVENKANGCHIFYLSTCYLVFMCSHCSLFTFRLG